MCDKSENCSSQKRDDMSHTKLFTARLFPPISKFGEKKKEEQISRTENVDAKRADAMDGKRQNWMQLLAILRGWSLLAKQTHKNLRKTMWLSHMEAETLKKSIWNAALLYSLWKSLNTILANWKLEAGSCAQRRFIVSGKWMQRQTRPRLFICL